MTPPATTAPRRADAVRNRQRVLDAATEAFTELGLDARMEDIARRAGVGVGTVYRHFPTKEALLGELLAEKWRALRDTVQHSLDNEPDPWEAYAGALKRNAEIMAGDAAVRGAVMLSDSPEVWDHAAGAHQELMAVTEVLVERGKAAGVLRADLQVTDIPPMMAGVCATIDVRGPAGQADWRRHLELALDGTRRRAA
ncbi:MAG TPA: helix-turn-helix domain-containing protein [Thermoleophilaceae bacterium]|nr:helix-turn-helix domain-containing protein [Thermoleophilaceae bacterium]